MNFIIWFSTFSIVPCFSFFVNEGDFQLLQTVLNGVGCKDSRCAAFDFNQSQNCSTGSSESQSIDCDSQGFITTLKVNRQEPPLSGTIDPIIQQFSKLNWLDLSNNLLRSTIPPLSASVEFLNLEYNLLQGTLPPLSNTMFGLFISHNNLTGYFPSTTQNITFCDIYNTSECPPVGFCYPRNCFLNDTCLNCDFGQHSNGCNRRDQWNPGCVAQVMTPESTSFSTSTTTTGITTTTILPTTSTLSTSLSTTLMSTTTMSTTTMSTTTTTIPTTTTTTPPTTARPPNLVSFAPGERARLTTFFDGLGCRDHAACAERHVYDDMCASYNDEPLDGVDRSLWCASDGNVESIVINNVALTGTIDPVLILFHRLSILSITNGALHSTIPTLPINIRGLFLSSNELEGSLPAMPSSMANLVVDHNKLGGFLPDFSQTTLVSSDFTSCVLYRPGGEQNCFANHTCDNCGTIRFQGFNINYYDECLNREQYNPGCTLATTHAPTPLPTPSTSTTSSTTNKPTIQSPTTTVSTVTTTTKIITLPPTNRPTLTKPKIATQSTTTTSTTLSSSSIDSLSSSMLSSLTTSKTTNFISEKSVIENDNKSKTSSPASSSSSIYIIVTAVVLCLVFAMVALLIFFIIRSKQKSKNNNDNTEMASTTEHHEPSISNTLSTTNTISDANASVGTTTYEYVAPPRSALDDDLENEYCAPPIDIEHVYSSPPVTNL